ncbi:winged helix-turn-helix transcriptional regulator [Plastoroseomonas arctica]|uniref:Helix-turn-helix transcriptional regulator n=1 Tax=Plastoroseomonas arctica TaxID=1509237 RepID=A0AAF1JZB4_9PROT|nr:helix-turn-helix domain-containing protein [Plastoroseomonas arctica]MBR0656806.1 helix-turn-helix transcriptional regulator [Plastoroseomonas arctica]
MARSMAAGCPLDRVLGFLARSWTADVIHALGAGGPLHFSALRRVLPGRASARMLSVRVKDLHAIGLISRTQASTGRREVFYALTEDGVAIDIAIRRFALALDASPLPAALAARARAEESPAMALRSLASR